MSENEALPSTGSPLLDEVAGVIGLEAALRLSARFPGLNQYIRKAYGDADDVVLAIGRAAADRLAEVYGGTMLYIPRGPGLDWQVHALAAGGQLSRWEIAFTLRITERQVYRILNRPALETQQLSLFD